MASALVQLIEVLVCRAASVFMNKVLAVGSHESRREEGMCERVDFSAGSPVRVIHFCSLLDYTIKLLASILGFFISGKVIP